MKVSKGLSTWAGLVGAVAGFLLALATFMDTFNELDPLAGLGPLAAAGLVLWKVIDGRMKQATALAANPVDRNLARWADNVATASNTRSVTWGTPRPGVSGTFAPAPPPAPLRSTKPGEFDREPTAPPADELRELTDCA